MVETRKIVKAHKIRLNPTREQAAYFWRAAGVARFAFNWGLERYNRILDHNRMVKQGYEGELLPVTGHLLKKEFNLFKPTWASEVFAWAYQGAFSDLQAAFTRYFKLQKEGRLKTPDGWKGRKDKKPFGWPRFKSRDRGTPSFYIANIALTFDGNQFWFDKKRVGWVNMAEPLRFNRFNDRVMGARISYRANYWWLSVQVEMGHQSPEHNQDVVGVDLGIKYLAVTSDGQVFDNPKPLEAAQRKLRRLQRSFSRMEKGSQNWHKMKAKIAKLHYRVACIRNEASHQMTSQLTKEYGVIGLEDLNIDGMKQNHRIARAVSDAALYEKRRQFEYKAAWNGGQVVTVGRWFASSKTCSGCGWIKADLKINDREWRCDNCQQLNHRDGNAAINIKNETINILNNRGPSTYGDTLNACGAFSDSGATKQENGDT